MKRIAPIAAIAAAVTAIIATGFGARLFRWEMFTWQASVIAISLSLLMAQRTNELDRETIERQASIIRNQAELLGRILMEDNGGRD